jgi:hypothetical protein
MSAVLIDQYVKQLQNSNLEQRKRAIIGLGRTKDPAALRPLAQAYQQELDGELRQLAYQAGKFIRNQAAALPAPPPEHVPPFIEDPDATITRRPVTESAARMAMGLAEQALTLSTSGKVPQAIKTLNKALHTNPNLCDDTYFVSICAAILGTNEGDVIAALISTTRTQAIVQAWESASSKNAAEAHVAETKKLPWLAILPDILLYCAILVIAPIFLLVIFSQSFESWRALTEAAGTTPDASLRAASAYAGTIGITHVVVLAAAALMSGLFSLIVQSTVIHLSATLFMGGKGTMRYLMYKLVAYYNRRLAVGFGIAFLGIWLSITNDALPVLAVVGAILGLFVLLTLVKLGKRVGEAYKFSSGKGFVAALIASLMLIVSNAAVGYLIYILLGNALQTILPAL